LRAFVYKVQLDNFSILQAWRFAAIGT